MSVLTTPTPTLRPYVPQLLSAWQPTHGDARHMQVEGTLAFVDISGFTRLTERLARRGKVGAEEMSDLLNATFSSLLTDAQAQGADLVKWGGDAVLLLFRGPGHAVRAGRAAYDMRSTLRTVGRLRTPAGAVTLRMSVGIHSGAFDFYLVGDPLHHRELLVVGPAASETAAMEQLATAGQVVVSEATAALLPRGLHRSATQDGARVLRGRPDTKPQLPRPRSAEDDAHLAGFLPTALREHVLAQQGDAEHRNVAVAFVQFRGTDALTAQAGTAAVAEALDHVVRTVQHACALNGVTFFETDIDRDGGKVMLVAGAPRSGGRDEERMLRTARAIVERPGALPVRIGVNRGGVFSGDFGPSFRRTYSIKGDAVNLAARVMGKAGDGEVLATTATLVRSQTGFRTEPLEPFLVKGKAQPVQAARVGTVEGARRERRPPTPFVGRRAERAVLQEVLAAARLGQGTEVLVVGDAGIGKSRLAEQVLLAEAMRVLRGAGSAYAAATPYLPFRTLLREALGVADGAELAALVHRVAPDLLPWLPLLAVPLDVTVPATREAAELDEQFRKARLEESVDALLAAVLVEPTVLLIDDAQHLDDASADLVAALVADVGTRPWAVLVLRRDGAAGYVPGDAAVTVRPGPLQPDEATELVRAVDLALTPEARAALTSRSGGNPMFLEELVRAAARVGREAPLPESVQDLMTSQIDQLPPLDRTVLRYAAVVGVVADVSLLDQLLREQLEGDDLQEHLPALDELLARDGPDRVRFRHALLRDVAYEGLPYRRRQVLHEQVALALQRNGAGPELLSLHFFAAGRYEDAWENARIAGERARAKYANVEAVTLLERAVAAAGRCPDLAPTAIGAVLEQLGDVRELTGLTAEAADAYRRARRHARDDAVRTAELLFKEARSRQRAGRIAQSLRLLTRAMTALEGQGGPAAAVSRSHVATRYAWGRLTQQRTKDALAWATRAAREAEDAGDPATLAHAYNALHHVHTRAGLPEDVPYGALALRGYEELGDLAGQGHSATNLGVDASEAGRLEEALAFFGRARVAFTRVGNEAEQANAAYNTADVLLRLGRCAAAMPLLADALDTARAVDDDELVALVLRETGRACLGLGRLAEAARHLADARVRLTALRLAAELPLLAAAEEELDRSFAASSG